MRCLNQKITIYQCANTTQMWTPDRRVGRWSRRWRLGCCLQTVWGRRSNRAFTRSAAVSVAAQKIGGELTHPIGRDRGIAMSGFSVGEERGSTSSSSSNPSATALFVFNPIHGFRSNYFRLNRFCTSQTKIARYSALLTS